ncbi:MAG: glycosyltransferase [Geminicoccaceae bacterium]
MKTPRVLLWSQHLLGTGHLVRAIRLAAALADRDMRVTLVSGGPHVPITPPEGIEWLELPALGASDSEFSGLVDENGVAAGEEVWQARKRQLEEALADQQVDIVITEMFPFGRRAFRTEIASLISLARAANPALKVVGSVRDILVSKTEPERYRWSVDWVQAHYEKILVHGDPTLIPFEETFPLAEQIRDRLVHTGYVVDVPTLSVSNRSGVVVSAGGGAVGHALLSVVMEYLRVYPPGGERWRLVGGSRMAQESLDHLRETAPGGVDVEGHVINLPERIARARIAISQAGYNTVAETLALRTPVLLVPFETDSEDEQVRRARAVERTGRGIMLRERDLAPASLKAAIERALLLGETQTGIDIGGAERSARIVEELVKS